MRHKIALGTVQFGIDYGISNETGQTNVEEVKNILQIAGANGIRTLDTAFAYGSSEKVIGNAAFGEWSIISKFPPETEKQGVSYFLDQSLDLLKRDKIKAYLAHDANTIINHPHVWDELKRLQIEGRIAKIGYSVYNPAQLDTLLNLKKIPDIVQLPFSFLDRRFLHYFAQLKNLNVEIHTRSAFLQGIFFVDPLKIDVFFSPIVKLLQQLQSAFQPFDKLAAALLRFCLQIDEIDKVVIGVNTGRQLSETLQMLDNEMPDISEYDHLINAAQIPDAILLPYKWPQK